uniref:F-box protein 3 n=1 Tax=Eptatretus burgeri TaxID=7764 RepID=A0A8C4NJZ7_EPTBU
MAGSPVPMSIHLLPVDPLLHVFSFVDFRSLARCAQVCRRFRHLAEHETLWKSHCRMCWLLEQLPARQTWRGLFQDTYRDLGRYVTVYAPLKRTWLDLEEFLKNHCPSLMATLKGGATEQMLHAVEEKIGRILPEDLRCSLRIHNGQMLKGTGLMGSVAISYHHRSECLLDVETAMQGYSQQRRLIDSLPLTFCTRTGLTQYIALSDVGGRARGNVFYHSPNQTDSEICDAFLTGRHFSEWFMEYVRNVVGRKYPLIGEEIFRYMETGNVARTGSISVSVSTAFLPEFSFIHPPHYSFSYRIRS